MTNLVGLLVDATGVGISGNLIVTPNSAIVFDNTTPKKLQLPQVKVFEIEDGVINIELNESETNNTSYNFDFKPLIGGVVQEESLKSFPFDAVIDNVASIDITDLVPTSMVTDVLATGALRIGRVIAQTPTLAALVGGLTPKGDWAASTIYQYNNLVRYNYRLYICKSLSPIIGVIPSDINPSWMEIPVEPEGIIGLGSSTPYGDLWDGSNLPPSQNTVYDQIQELKSNVDLKANLISPVFTGSVTVPNQTLGDASTKAANTNFVAAGLALKANLTSPTFTGDPKAPTPVISDNDTSIATTAFVKNVIGNLRADGSNKIYFKMEGCDFLTKFGSDVVYLTDGVGTILYNGSPAFNFIYSVIAVNGDSNAINLSCNIQSFNTLGFVVTLTSPFTGNYRVNWVAFGLVNS